MKRHHAGRDLTTDIQAAPHGMEVLKRYPQVGNLKKEAADRELPKAMHSMLSRFPFLRRHPHPMMIHFPIVFMYATTIFNVLYVLTGYKPFETTALHCLAGGILLTPMAILTGLFSWWLNYRAKPMRAVTIKQRMSVVLFALEIIAFVWRIMAPGILDAFGFGSVIYFLMILSLLPVVTIIGWYGANLTFPIEKM